MSMASYAQKATLNHLAIYVVDLEKSTAFYKNVIGLDIIDDPFKDNKHTWFDMGGGVALHVILGANAITEQPRDNHFCFSVGSVHSFIQNLTKSNISYQNAKGETNKITIRPDGVQQVYFTDPDGYWIEINDAKRK